MTENNIIEIPITLIDPPDTEMRTQIIQEDLDCLTQSIKMYGLMSPIIVQERDERYKLIAGWRRMKAHEILGKAVIKAVVKNNNDRDVDMIRIHENIMREQINPIDEATYYNTIMKKHNWAIQDISIMTHKSNTYVSSRLKLLELDELLRTAVKDGVLVMSSALELQKIDNIEQRHRLLGFCVNSGATTEQVRKWRIEYEISKPRDLPTNLSEIAQKQEEEIRKTRGLPTLEQGINPQIELEEKFTEYRTCYSCMKRCNVEDAKLLILCQDCAGAIEEIINAKENNRKENLKE